MIETDMAKKPHMGRTARRMAARNLRGRLVSEARGTARGPRDAAADDTGKRFY